VKILIVDDSTAMRMLITRALRQAGLGEHTYLEARDAAEALAVVHAEFPDLVLSDCNMPNLSGIELLRALRAAGNRVRFGFVTVECGEAMRAAAEAAGAEFLIAKPFSAEAFAGLLAEALPA
jgi:two-component system chemotaxis response regulator CheY